MRRALRSGFGLGDVLHVGADEDQTAGAALAFAGGDAGADTALSSFKFGLFFRQFLHVEFALPRELNEGEQIELAREFARRLTGADNGERLPYTLAVHRGKGENPHAHLMISERANDGIERSREQWFKRYNSKEPEKGGARKSMTTRPKDWLEETRKEWADHANQALQRVGSRERIHEGTLDQQYRDALESGDELAAKRLKDQVPGVHIRPAQRRQGRARGGVGADRDRAGGRGRQPGD